MTERLSTRDFTFDYPQELVADHPLAQRDGSRLLFYRDGRITDHQFADLVDLLPKNALIVMNDSRVIPSRLFGQLPSGGKCEVFLLEPHDEGVWKVIGRPLKKFKPGVRIRFAEGVEAEIIDRSGDSALLHFTQTDAQEFNRWLHEHGYVPLPPYIHRPNPKPASQSDDWERYQTVYAEAMGSVAAPTAGLHFTDDLLERMNEKGIETTAVTLHVGGGTFLPVKSDDPEAHTMHEERYLVPHSVWRKIEEARSAGRSIFVVGTTAFRALESFHRLVAGTDANDHLDQWLRTDLFVWPRTKSEVHPVAWADGLITNFHQPESTLMMLVSALVGFEACQRIYLHAVEQRYRLFSFGDSSLLWLG